MRHTHRVQTKSLHIVEIFDLADIHDHVKRLLSESLFEAVADKTIKLERTDPVFSLINTLGVVYARAGSGGAQGMEALNDITKAATLEKQLQLAIKGKEKATIFAKESSQEEVGTLKRDVEKLKAASIEVRQSLAAKVSDLTYESNGNKKDTFTFKNTKQLLATCYSGEGTFASRTM